jgi:hypothetical protein
MTEEFLTDTLTGRRRCARELEFHPSPPTSPPPPQTAHQLAPSRVADRLTIYLFVAQSLRQADRALPQTPFGSLSSTFLRLIPSRLPGFQAVWRLHLSSPLLRHTGTI